MIAATSSLESALSLAARGFHVFPCRTGSKLPLKQGWQDMATTDPDAIRKTWGKRSYNIGIFTGKFGTDRALVVVDVDQKHGKRGDMSLLQLEMNGADLPATLEHSTPSGRHIIYVTPQPLKQGVDVLGEGLDVRSRGGYILGPGSVIDGKTYAQINGHNHLVPAPSWLVERLGVDRRESVVSRDPLPGVDPDRAVERAIAYLATAPLAVEGERGDLTTYKVAAQVKDFGCSLNQAVGLLAGFWNDRCSPPWSDDELTEKVSHAFKYGKEAPGSAAPEAVFQDSAQITEPDEEAGECLSPYEKLNLNFAFTPAGGGHIIWETSDPKGRFKVEHLDLGTFHAMWAWHTVMIGEKRRAVSKVWMEWKDRRTFDGFVFAPCREVDPRWYNLWRGFRVEPADSPHHPAVEAFLEHALANVCGGDLELFKWLMGYFAHLIQRPWEKPLVALVFKGKKGTGKNALIERVGNLLGHHFLVADDSRYLLGNFNGHLENCLCLVLDEAFWSGDKKAEGRLKGLITGSEHLIEHKGKEPYRVDNLTRVLILGNEEWLVPATQDERRFAVFSVGDGRIQDRAFFEGMRKGMEAGGYAHLLRYLMDFDLTGIDVNQAPNTQGLVAQKHASLRGPERWLADVLTEESIHGHPWTDSGLSVPKTSAYDSYVARSRARYGEHHPVNESFFWKRVKALMPKLEDKRPNKSPRNVVFPPLYVARRAFEAALGGEIDWGEST